MDLGVSDILMHDGIIATASSYVSYNISAPLEYKSHLTDLLWHDLAPSYNQDDTVQVTLIAFRLMHSNESRSLS